MATFEEVKGMLKILGAAFPASKVTTDTAAVYAIGLQDLEIEELRAAVAWLLSNHESNFLPSIATIRRAAKQSSTAKLPTSTEMLAEVKREIRRVGHARSPEFSHPAIGKSVDAIGWRQICMSTEPGIVMAQLRKAYEVYAERYVQDQRQLPQDGRVMQALSGLSNKMRALEKSTNTRRETWDS